MIKNSDKSIAIIGCGWLGQPFAKLLKDQGYSVIGTCQSEASLQQLQTANIEAIQLSLPCDIKKLSEHPALNQHTLVIAFPPQLKKGAKDYPEKVAAIVSAAEQTKVRKIILVSSTGIYNGLAGEVSETSALDTNNEKVKLLLAAEQALQKFSGDNSILRLSGLVGPKRHPGRFFRSGKTLSQPKAVLNLIHQQDAVGLLFSLIQDNAPMGVYNGVSETKAVKQEFYQAAARSLKMDPPVFDSADLSCGRKVNGDKARTALSYHYIYNDLLRWV